MTEGINVIGLDVDQVVGLLRRESIFIDGPSGDKLLIVCDIPKEELETFLKETFGDGEISFGRKLDG